MPRLSVLKNLSSLLVLLSLAVSARAEWQGVGTMVPAVPTRNQIRFNSPEAHVIITVLAPDLIRVRMIPGATIGPDHSWAVVKTDWPQFPVQFSGDSQMKVIKTTALELRIQLSPFRLAFYDLEGRLISEDARAMAYEGERVRCWKRVLPDEHYYGLGEKAGPLDKRGRSFVMWNTDPAGYDALTDPMYQTVPFFIGVRSGKAHGIFFDNTYR